MDLDHALLSRLYAGDSRGVVYLVMVVLSAIGGGWGMLALAPLLASRKTRRAGAALLVTLALTTVLVASLKALFGRVRPCFAVPGVRALCFAAPTDPSFPSGHAAGSFAFAAFVGVWLWRSNMQNAHKWLGVSAAFAFAIGVAASRVVLGVHYPSDVTAGAIVGALLGLVAAQLALRPARA